MSNMAEKCSRDIMNDSQVASSVFPNSHIMTMPKPKYTERKVTGDIARILTGRNSYVVKKLEVTQ